MAVQASSGEVPAYHRRKKLKSKKPLRVDGLKKIRGTVSVHGCHPSPKAAQINAKRDLRFLLRGRMSVSVSTWLPSCAECYQRGPLLSHPIQYTEVCGTTWGQKGTGRTADQALRGHQRDTNPTNCFVESIRKTAHKLLGVSHLQISPAGPRAPQALHLPQPHLPPSCGWFPVCPPRVVNGSLCRQLVSMGRKLAQLCKIGREHTNLSNSGTLRRADRRL